MKNRWIVTLLVGIGLVGATVGAGAQSAPQPAGSPQKVSPTDARRASTAQLAPRYSGTIKGEVKGQTFVLVTRRGEFTVRFRADQVRQRSGQSASASALRAGVRVSVVGIVRPGKRIEATTVTVLPAAAPRSTGPRPAKKP